MEPLLSWNRFYGCFSGKIVICVTFCNILHIITTAYNLSVTGQLWGFKPISVWHFRVGYVILILAGIYRKPAFI